MFCSACGSEISLAAEVCPTCGRPVALASARQTTARANSTLASLSGPWQRPAQTLVAPTSPNPSITTGTSVAPASPGPSAPASATIFAGDLDLPGFPRDMPGRVALLTGLAMMADLLLPWVSVNSDAYAATSLGLPALALVAVLAVVIAPPLIPQLRRRLLTRMAPFGVGALSLGVSGALWMLTGPLAPTLVAALGARVGSAVALDSVTTVTQFTGAMLQIRPAIGLYLFLLGACVLLVAGYKQVCAPGRLADA